MRYLLLTVFLFIAIGGPVVGEEKPWATSIKVAGHPVKAQTAEQFVLISNTVQSVNALKRKRASGNLDEQEYRIQVALYLNTLISNGVRIN